MQHGSSRATLNALLDSRGPGSTAYELERRLAEGDWTGAQRLHEATDPMAAVSAQMRGMVQRDSEPVMRGDVGGDFVRKYGG